MTSLDKDAQTAENFHEFKLFGIERRDVAIRVKKNLNNDDKNLETMLGFNAR